MAETNRHGMNRTVQLCSMGLVIRQKEPKNLETPFDQLDSFLTPSELFFEDYGNWDDVDGQPVRRALGEMQVKSEIARPGVYETLAANTSYTIAGAAW